MTPTVTLPRAARLDAWRAEEARRQQTNKARGPRPARKPKSAK